MSEGKLVEKSELEEEAEGEFLELVWAYHKKGLKYSQMWLIIHNLLKEVTTLLMGETYCNGGK